MYARNVKGLTVQNVRFEFEEADLRPAVIFDNVQDASVNGLSVQGSPQTEAVRLINCKDLLFSATRVLTSASSFLSVEGAASEGITVNGGDISKASRQVVYRDGGSDKAVKISV
jgi:hypothetical protein